MDGKPVCTCGHDPASHVPTLIGRVCYAWGCECLAYEPEGD